MIAVLPSLTTIASQAKLPVDVAAMRHGLHTLFTPTVALWEVVVRATMMYLLLLFTFRFTLKRQGGVIGVPDLLVVFLIVDSAQNAVTGGAQSVTESAVLIATILSWTYLINWSSWRFKRLRWLTAPPPMELIRDGRVNRRNMRSALLSCDELMTQLREQGVDEISKVAKCYMEGDGEISVITFDKDRVGQETKSRPL